MKKLLPLLTTITLLCVPTIVHAAEISFSAQKVIRETKVVEATITLDTEGERVNAFEGTVTLPEDSHMLYLSDAQSIITTWIHRPTIRSNRIFFSGITPGGYTGTSGTLLQIAFEIPEADHVEIGFKDFAILRNDGDGTPTEVRYNMKPLAFEGLQTIDSVLDTVAPHPFTAEIVRLNNSNDIWYVLFSTNDKQSGIKTYEIAESLIPTAQFITNWKSAESPHPLKNQLRTHYVYVKAIDNAGNESIIDIDPQIPVSIILVGLFLLFAGFSIYRLTKQRKKMLNIRERT